MNEDNFESIIIRNKKNELDLLVVSDCIGFSDYKKENEYLKLENIVKMKQERFRGMNSILTLGLIKLYMLRRTF